jgi:flagellar biosynthesis protein FliP
VNLLGTGAVLVGQALAIEEPGLSLNVSGGGSAAVKLFLLMTLLSFATALLVSVTSFTRIGASILLLHDSADIFLESAKVCTVYTVCMCAQLPFPSLDLLRGSHLHTSHHTPT